MVTSSAIRTVQSWFGPIRIDPDPDFAPYKPSRKVRGRRRYYRALRRDAAAFRVSPHGWYDYMHWHADWVGLGNLSWKERAEHLHALFTMFQRLLESVGGWTTPHQVWVTVDPADSSQDAVYLHTPNPNAENFPNTFSGVEWNVDIPDRLRDFVTTPEWQFGRLDGRWTHFVVRPRPAA